MPTIDNEPALAADELRLVADYRNIRRQGTGAVYVEFADGRVTKYDVRIGGGARVMNALLGNKTKLRE